MNTNISNKQKSDNEVPDFLIQNNKNGKKKALVFIYGLLIILTMATAFISNSFLLSRTLIGVILGFSAIKFILVAFQFMELKKAHVFWKASLLLVLGLLLAVLIFS
jgi:heme/copper-type cytochrome/quinol oxidase subunit 4